MSSFFKFNKAKVISAFILSFLAVVSRVNFVPVCDIGTDCPQPFITPIIDFVHLALGGKWGWQLVGVLQFGNYQSLVVAISALFGGLIFVLIYNFVLVSVFAHIYRKFRYSRTEST